MLLHASQRLTCVSKIPGIYQDHKNGVVDGACALLLIHTDKIKTKEREKKERERQQSGENITKSTTAPQFLAGLSDLPDIRIETTSSGSMTQEMFYAYAKHFVSSLTQLGMNQLSSFLMAMVAAGAFPHFDIS